MKTTDLLNLKKVCKSQRILLVDHNGDTCEMFGFAESSGQVLVQRIVVNEDGTETIKPISTRTQEQVSLKTTPQA